MFVEYITTLIIKIISSMDYFGIFTLMLMESMFFPIPSEVVMPLAGFLIVEGRFSFLGILIASSFGSLIGSLISYCIGIYGGRPLIVKYGKYFLVNKKHLEITEKFFSKKGDKTILISRFIPVVRHLISIPAGIAEMNISKFVIYTAIGSTIWNMFLVFLGFKLKDQWNLIHKYSGQIDIIFIILIIIFIVYFIINQINKRK